MYTPSISIQQQRPLKSTQSAIELYVCGEDDASESQAIGDGNQTSAKYANQQHAAAVTSRKVKASFSSPLSAQVFPRHISITYFPGQALCARVTIATPHGSQPSNRIHCCSHDCALEALQVLFKCCAMLDACCLTALGQLATCALLAHSGHLQHISN